MVSTEGACWVHQKQPHVADLIASWLRMSLAPTGTLVLVSYQVYETWIRACVFLYRNLFRGTYC